MQSAEIKRKAKNVIATRSSKQWSSSALLLWINDKLKCKVERIEDLRTGAVYCNLLDSLFPGSIRMNRVKFVCNQPREYLDNFRLLQQGFRELEVNTPINVEVLTSGRILENYEFAAWFHQFYVANCVNMPNDCDPVAARNQQPIALGGAYASKSKKIYNQKPTNKGNRTKKEKKSEPNQPSPIQPKPIQPLKRALTFTLSKPTVPLDQTARI